MASRIKFGTGGYRAIIGEGFTRGNVELIAAAIAGIMRQDHVEDSPVVIGYDRRFLSDIAAKWISEVLVAAGISVRMIAGESPTPLIMFYVKEIGAEYGIAVTASHNPAQYNGIKVFTRGGRDATEQVTDRIEREIEEITRAPRRICFRAAVQEGSVQIVYPHNDYIDSILSMIDIGKIRQRNIRVLLDPMFGVSKTSLQTVLMTCRCQVEVINDRHDALFGGRLPSPSAKTLQRLSEMVVDGRFDLGIATDGDADRIGLIDASGRFIHPNDILVLLYYYLLKYRGWKGPAVRNISTTHRLDRIAAQFGETCYEVPVGFKHISEKMEKTDALIGGESSGGLTVRGHIQGKDGIYAAALLVEMLCVIQKPLSEILEDIHREFGGAVMEEFDAGLTEEQKESLRKTLFEDKKLPDYPYPVEKVSYLDGCKVYFQNGGWIICRFSGTEPVVRIFCEMEDQPTAAAAIQTMRDFLHI